MDEHQISLILDSSSISTSLRLAYGTSGFRADASILHSTLFGVGILAALRSLKTQSLIGLMVIASHNKATDNGVKVADPSGGMLTQDCEPFVDATANAATLEDLVQLIDDFVKKENIPLDELHSAEILLGRDSRPSGESLLEAATKACPPFNYHNIDRLFAIPLGYDLVWRNCLDDYKSPVSIWHPRAPEGYVSPGFVAVSGFEEPGPILVWCAAESIVEQTEFEEQKIWSAPDSYPWACHIYQVKSDALHFTALRQNKEQSDWKPLWLIDHPRSPDQSMGS